MRRDDRDEEVQLAAGSFYGTQIYIDIDETIANSTRAEPAKLAQPAKQKKEVGGQRSDCGIFS